MLTAKDDLIGNDQKNSGYLYYQIQLGQGSPHLHALVGSAKSRARSLAVVCQMKFIEFIVRRNTFI